MYKTKLALIPLFLVLIVFTSVSQVTQQWVARYNGPVNGIDVPCAVIIDGSGNVFVTGKSAGIGTGFDFATVKYNSAGVQVWASRYDGPGDSTDIPVGIAFDGLGNIYVGGSSRGVSSGFDFVVVKYSPSGAQQWVARTSFNGDDTASSFAVDAAGNSYITGTYGYTIQTVKYNSAGVQQWIDNYSYNNHFTIGTSLALDNQSNLYVTGQSADGCCSSSYVTMKYSPSGTQQWVQRHGSGGGNWGEVTFVAEDNFGRSYVTGWSGGTIRTIKYDTSGSELWENGYGGSTSNHKYSLAVDGSQNVYVAGVSILTPTLIKYNASGSQQWFQPLGGVDVSSVSTDVSGNVYTAGGNGADFFVMKFNSLGISQWTANYNGTGNSIDAATNMTIDASGNIYVTGYSFGVGTDFDFATVKYSQLTGVQPTSSEIPKQFNLYQNYPNPFNPSTKIKFDIPNTGVVNMTVYDVTGRRVSTLVNEQLNPGSYEVIWNSEDLPSGTYLCRIIAGQFEKTNKLVLLK